MSTTTLRTPAFVPDARSAPPQGTRGTSGPQAHRGLRYALLALVAALVVFAALAGIALLRTQGSGIDSATSGGAPMATDAQAIVSVPRAALLADAADARWMGAPMATDARPR
ncbi:MAG: hypothetical protein IPO93_08975 [Actinobacteria bacterium]|nr:hypothetical protein [Actinomycetota bacterium]